jgi:hypothetical protein
MVNSGGYMELQGYDYAAKPLVLVGGDMGFIQLLQDGFLAVGYDTVPEFGLLVNPPLLTIMFDTTEAARECFAHFIRWGGASGDGDAVRISFVELDDGGYGMCTSQDMEKLLNRVVPEMYRDEVEPRIMVVGHLKTFPQMSEGYLWFKSRVETSPFVLAPSSRETPPMREFAIRKREVNFYHERDLSEHSVEASLIRNRNATEEVMRSRTIPPEIRFGAKSFSERRRSQLRRFFPVTLERLSFNKPFSRLKEQLISEGFREWQIVQAACNIALRCRASELFASNNSDEEGASSGEQSRSPALNILGHLLNNPEDINVPFPSEDQLSAAPVREQIYADAYELLRYFTDSNQAEVQPVDLQSELAKHNLLDE